MNDPLPKDKESLSSTIEEHARTVTVREFATAPSLGLDIEILTGQEGLLNEIRSPRLQKMGLSFAGFSTYLHPERVQIIGRSEVNFLRILDAEGRGASVGRLKGQGICCIFVTNGLDPPEELLTVAREEKIPLLRSKALSSVSVRRITSYLEERLAPQMTIHGVLLEIFGLGVLLLGPSGIGKSECALELLLKGHRLIADDFVELTRLGTDRLSGMGGRVLKHHMELRGLGIIDIRELFGISATGGSQNVDIAVRLERWKRDAEYDRIGLEQRTVEFLGIPVPLIEMPVAPGRNVATLIEVAARIHLLRQRGYRPSKEILDTLPGPGDSEAR